MQTIELRAILERLGKRPDKRLGQNFLIDQSVIHAAIEAGGVQKGDLVLEIGPGLGVLTEALLEKGASVIAIEKDRIFAERLQSLHPSESDSRLRVISGDASQMEWMSILSDCRQPSAVSRQPNWKFISNVPYNITSLLLRKALWNSNPPSLGVVLIQKEVAERCLSLLRFSPLAPRPSHLSSRPSLLSLMIALSCSSARIVRNVPPRCFFPPPKVNSVVFEFIPLSVEERIKKWGIDAEEVMKVAKLGFAHPRKQLASNLVSGEREVGSGMSKEKMEEILKTLSLNPKIRSEELSIQNWVDLTKMVRGDR
jgi:16S rRNA (adenine1518-N6/adenine1519-N6)-dimethyltransferase